MSNFIVEVVRIEKIEKHPNADLLGICKVFDGYQCVVRLEDWKKGDLAAYLPPDSVVPNTEQFKFLEGHLKISARRFRGEESYGMLIPAPEGSVVGDDVADILGIKHYDPELSAEINSAQGEFQDPPPIDGVIYDIEPWQKYRNEFVEGEEVVITEKIHGANSRYTFQNGKMYCGSHYQWKKIPEQGKNLYWNVLEYCPWVEAFCRLNPDVILYGEIFGAVQKGFNYGVTQECPYKFRAFDVFAAGQFLDYDDALGGAKSDFLVPVLYRGPYSIEVMQKYVNGLSTIEGAKHIREGCVVKCIKERYSERLHGRLILKYVSIDYLEDKRKK